MSFYFFRRYFFSHRAGSLIRWVSWIGLAGMTISLSALILIMSIMGGFGQAIKSRLLSQSAHLSIRFKGPPLIQSQEKGRSLFLGKEKWPLSSPVLSLEQKRGIQSITFFETQEVILQSTEGFKGVLAIGHPQQEWDKMLSQAFEEPSHKDSSFLEEESRPPLSLLSKKEVLLSHELALAGGLFSGDISLIPLAGLLLPSHIPPPIKNFKIKGVLPPAEYEKSALSIYYPKGLMDFGDFSKIRYGAEIRLYDPEQAPFYKKLLSAYSSRTWMEANSNMFFALKLEKFIMTLFLTITLLLSCLGLSSALFLLITQKREDLAILQAMGFSQKDTVRLFTFMGMFLSAIGISLGFLLAMAVLAFLKLNSFPFLPEIYQDRSLPTQLMPISYLLAIAGAFICSWLSCYLPARHISHIKLSELLKTTVF